MRNTGVLILGLLLAVTSGCSKRLDVTANDTVAITPSSSPTSVRGYVVPSFQGWQSESYLKSGADEVNSVLLRKDVGEQKLNVKFTLFPPPLSGESTGVEALRRNTTSTLAMGKHLARSFQLLTQKETTYRGFPAIETKVRTKAKDGNITESRSLDIAGRESNFSISSNITGKFLTDEGLQEANQTFDKMSNELKLP